MVSSGAVETKTKFVWPVWLLGTGRSLEDNDPKPVSTAVNRVVQLAMPGLRQIQD